MLQVKKETRNDFWSENRKAKYSQSRPFAETRWVRIDDVVHVKLLRLKAKWLVPSMRDVIQQLLDAHEAGA